MKLVFFGDSITEAGRNLSVDGHYSSYGYGFVRQIAGTLLAQDPTKYTIVNRGIGGDMTVNLYARIKNDVWNQAPDVLTILVGVNDLSQEIADKHGVELPRFEKVYTAIIEETLERLPSVRIILCEPFILHGSVVDAKYEEYLEIERYARVVEKLAKKYGLTFVPLQEKFRLAAEKYGVEPYIVDGVHPNIAGATLIAEEWLKAFKRER